MDLDLSHKHALVCGATRGIGRATAAALAALGARVTMFARDERALAAAAIALPAVEDGAHDFLVADFNDPDAVRRALHGYLPKHGPVHVLVNNTGGPAPGAASAASVDDFERAFHRHLVCNHVLVLSVLDGMKTSGYGRIVNVVSTSVREPIRGLGVSNTIRAAVAGWAKTLSVELGPHGITVNNVLPGATRTGRMVELNEEKAQREGVDIEAIERRMLAEIPLGRFAAPEEIADVIAFLASPAAGYISGVSLQVDGGRMRSI